MNEFQTICSLGIKLFYNYLSITSTKETIIQTSIIQSRAKLVQKRFKTKIIQSTSNCTPLKPTKKRRKEPTTLLIYLIHFSSFPLLFRPSSIDARIRCFFFVIVIRFRRKPRMFAINGFNQCKTVAWHKHQKPVQICRTDVRDSRKDFDLFRVFSIKDLNAHPRLVDLGSRVHPE